VTSLGAELAVRALAVVETADAGFFRVTEDVGTLVAMLRPLARD
jgi:hypothetical protein